MRGCRGEVIGDEGKDGGCGSKKIDFSCICPFFFVPLQAQNNLVECIPRAMTY